MYFLRNRMFRQTLLCHADREPRYDVQPERLTTLWVASPVQPRSPFCDATSTTPEEFQGLNGAVISSADPIVKAAFLELADAWPQALPFTELRSLAHRRTQSGLIEDAATVAQDTQQLGQFLLECYMTGLTNLLELAPRQLPLAKQAGERPRTWPLARWQAGLGSNV